MQFVLRIANDFEVLVPSSNRALAYSPGDEFHQNPLATSLLGIHYPYSNGKATAGNINTGVIAIRCGGSDIIESTDYIIFDTRNQDTTPPKAFLVTYERKQWVRILLAANISTRFRNTTPTQYYLGNMIIHEIFKDETWKITFRSFLPTVDLQLGRCPCCKSYE